jgi:hypothetical protein
LTNKWVAHTDSYAPTAQSIEAAAAASAAELIAGLEVENDDASVMSMGSLPMPANTLSGIGAGDVDDDAALAESIRNANMAEFEALASEERIFNKLTETMDSRVQAHQLVFDSKISSFALEVQTLLSPLLCCRFNTYATTF